MNSPIQSKIASLWFDGELIELIPEKMEQKNNQFVLNHKGVEFSIQLDTYGENAFYCKLSLSNLSETNSPRIKNVNAFDCEFETETNPILSTLSGDSYLAKSQMQEHTNLPAGFIYSAEPTGGRSSNTTAFPYFNITDNKRSRVFAIGWSGQWKSDVIVNTCNYRVMVGISHCDFYLKPHESVIFPSMLVLEGENLTDARNKFRRLIIDHFSPKGSPEKLRPICFNIGSCFDDTKNTEEFLLNQVEKTEKYDFDVVWADAIWFKGKWDKGVGNYDFKDILPNGLKPVSDLAHKQNKRFLQWFEIERAFPGTDMHTNHRDKVLRCYTRTEFDLVDFGNPDTLEYVFQKLCGMIEKQGIDIFRQDANIDMLLYWEYNDEKDRVGIKQLHYIEGLYQLWDKLLARFPGLMIDNCASGGRRLDFEAMSRSVSFCSSDYPNDGVYGEMIKYNNIHLSNLNLYIPNASCIYSSNANTYCFRAGYNGAVSIGALEKFTENYTSDKAALLIAEAKRLRSFYYGDFYQLTEEEADFSAYEFKLGNKGFAMFLRHEKSTNDSVTVCFNGVEADKKYEIDITDENLECKKEVVDGKLLKDGFTVRLKEVKTSLIIEYSLIEE